MNLRLSGLLSVTLAVLFEAFGQLAFKHSAESAQAHDGTLGFLRSLSYQTTSDVLVASGPLCCHGTDRIRTRMVSPCRSRDDYHYGFAWA